jgi:hypothetical protein
MRNAFRVGALAVVAVLAHPGLAARADETPTQATAPQQQSAVTLHVDGMS